MTIEEILNSAKSAAEKVGKKTEDVVEVTKTKMAISTAEKEMAATYEGLGRLVYDSRKSGDDITDMIEAAAARVDELQAEIDELYSKVYEVKKMKECASCNTINPADADYCKRCGNKL